MSHHERDIPAALVVIRAENGSDLVTTVRTAASVSFAMWESTIHPALADALIRLGLAQLSNELITTYLVFTAGPTRTREVVRRPAMTSLTLPVTLTVSELNGKHITLGAHFCKQWSVTVAMGDQHSPYSTLWFETPFDLEVPFKAPPHVPAASQLHQFVDINEVD